MHLTKSASTTAGRWGVPNVSAAVPTLQFWRAPSSVGAKSEAFCHSNRDVGCGLAALHAQSVVTSRRSDHLATARLIEQRPGGCKIAGSVSPRDLWRNGWEALERVHQQRNEHLDGVADAHAGRAVGLHVRARRPQKVYGELKRGFAFDCVPTMRYAANSAWQLLSVLAFNLMRGFQLATTAERRGQPASDAVGSASRPSTRCATSACTAPGRSSDPTAMQRSTSAPPRLSPSVSSASSDSWRRDFLSH